MSRNVQKTNLICRSIVLTLLIITYSYNLVSQSKRATKLYNLEQYALAIPILEKEYSKTNTATIAEKLAISYWKINKYNKAEEYFKILETENALTKETAFIYGQVLKSNNKAKEAVVVYAANKLNNTNDFKYRFNELQKWEKQNPNFDINEINGINSKASEFSPTKYKDKLVYVSDQLDDYVYDLKSGRTGKPFLSIFEATPTSDSLNFEDQKLFHKQFNEDYHTGPITFDTSYTLAFYTVVKNLKKGSDFENKPQLYFSVNTNNKWSSPKPFSYNNENYSLAHPTLSEDGKMLIFTSDLPDGFGGKDLYASYLIGSAWSKPLNLGKGVNTNRDEVFPYLLNKNTLYFSSNGHTGFGGYDLFLSNKTSKWSTAINLKTPINSTKDDFGLIFFGENWGYFSSNRSKGMGDDDIYHFKSLLDSTKNSIEITGIFMYSELSPANGQELQILDENDIVLSTTYTNEKGAFVFSNLEPDRNYKIKLANEDVQLDADALIIITNDKGDKVMQLTPDSKGVFKYKTLKADRFEKLSEITLNDEEIKLPWVYGRAFKKLPGDLPEGLEVLVLDDNGNILLSTFIDENGSFKFENLPLDKNYKIRLKEFSDEGIIVLLDQYNKEIAKLIPDGKGGFNYEILSSDKAAMNLLKNSDIFLTLNTLISGLVELPYDIPDNLSLILKDDQGFIIDTIFVDQNGRFTYSNLSPYENYSLTLTTSDNELDLSDANIFLLNNDGKKVQVLNKDFTFFTFQTLSKEEYNTLPPLSDSDVQFGIAGKIYNYLPGDLPEGLEVLLLDDQGNILDRAITDRFGNFNFKTLPSDNNYTISVVNTNDEDLKLFIVDEARNEVQVQGENGKFTYKKLTKEHARLLQLIEEDNAHTTLRIANNKELPKNAQISLLDENKNFIKKIKVQNDNKTIRLTNLNSYKEYYIALYGVNNETTDFIEELNAINEKNKPVVKISKEGKNLFKFYALKAYEYEMLPNLIEVDEELTVSGRIETATELNSEGLKVFILDENGNIIDTTYTDKRGRFNFEKLPPQETFLIKVNSNAPEDIQLFVFGEGNTEEEITLNTNENGYQLTSKFTKNLKGKLLNKLPRDNQEGLTLFLLDDQGNIVDSLVTTRFGDFEFKRLSTEKKYFIKVKGISDQNLDLFLFNQNGELSKAKLNNSNQAYPEPGSIIFVKKDFKGKVFTKLEGDLPEGLKVYMLNDQGMILDSAIVDKRGHFNFTKLPKDNNYKLFAQTGEDIPINFIEFDENGKEKPLDSKRTFNYTQLAKFNNLIDALSLDDVTGFIMPEEEKTVYFGNVYHPYDRDGFTEESQKLIKKLIQTLNKNGQLSVKIVSHTDSKGSDIYNQLLSTERAQYFQKYLEKRGVENSRIYIDALGEKLPASTNHMPDGGDNPPGRKINRRSEIYLIR